MYLHEKRGGERCKIYIWSSAHRFSSKPIQCNAFSCSHFSAGIAYIVNYLFQHSFLMVFIMCKPSFRNKTFAGLDY